MVHQGSLLHRWRRSLFAALILPGVLLGWWAFQVRKPAPSQLTQKDLVRTLLAKARQSGEVKVSAEAPAMWVRVENPKPIANANNHFPPRSICVTDEGARVVLVKRQEQRLLLRYVALYDSGGTACPDGTLFSLSAARAINRPPH